MEIKIIKLDGMYIDAVSNDCDLLNWAENWITHNDFNIDFWLNSRIIINEKFIYFKGDNGILQLDIITKTI